MSILDTIEESDETIGSSRYDTAEYEAVIGKAATNMERSYSVTVPEAKEGSVLASRLRTAADKAGLGLRVRVDEPDADGGVKVRWQVTGAKRKYTLSDEAKAARKVKAAATRAANKKAAVPAAPAAPLGSRPARRSK